jgi:hypothetical protein
MPNDTSSFTHFINNDKLFSITRERGSDHWIQTTVAGPKQLNECSLEYAYDIVAKMDKLQDKQEVLFTANRVAVSFARGFCEVMLVGSNTTMRMTKTALSQLLTVSRSAWSISELMNKIRRAETLEHGLKALSIALSLDFQACLDKDLHFRTCLTRVGNDVERIVYGVTSTKYTPFDAKEMLECLHSSGFGAYSLQNLSITREGVVTAFSEIPITKAELHVQVPCLRVGGGFVKNQAVWLSAYLFKLFCSNGCGTTKVERESSWTRSCSFQTIADGLKSTATGKLTEAQLAVEKYKASLGVMVGDLFAEFMSGIMTDAGVSARSQDNVFRFMADETVTKNGSVATVVDVITRAAQEESQSTQLLLEATAWDALFDFSTEERVLEYVTSKRAS